MASDNEDDYLSDKFLLESAAAAAPKKPLTYAERRKQAQRQAEIKNAQSRIKGRRAREAEALEQGLGQSLFERAKAEEQESGAKNKAMSMMLRMGFKPGESLGRSDGSGPSDLAAARPSASPSPTPERQESPSFASARTTVLQRTLERKDSDDRRHRTAPLALDVWSGKKGVGLGKRAPSPETTERASKAARMEEETKHETYRTRTREAFEERRALGRLSAASRTLMALDEKAGMQFNILSLNPQEPQSFPSELLEALAVSFDDEPATVAGLNAQDSEKERLRKRMQRDALQPLETGSPNGDSDDDKATELPKKETPFPLSLSQETIDEAREFLQLEARDRLDRVLRYLREKYYYCFWCGTQYNDKSDLDDNCPGEDEEAHD